MYETKRWGRLRRLALPLGLMAVGVLVFGTVTTFSQEEEPDVCAGYTEEAYAFCVGYCVDFDCDSATPKGTEEECLYVFDRFEGLTGDIPPCEPPPEE